MSNVAVLDQNAGEDVLKESPLAHTKGVPSGHPTPGVTIKEVPFLGYLTLRGNSADPLFVAGVAQALGIELPVAPLTLNQHPSNDSSIQWISPDEWLVVVPRGSEYEAEMALRSELSGHYAVVNISGGQTLLRLSGEQALEVLYKSTPYDLHPRHFVVGKAITTNFAKATAVIRRPSEDVWELIIRRSFADYCYRWLMDASQEFGVHYE